MPRALWNRWESGKLLKLRPGGWLPGRYPLGSCCLGQRQPQGSGRGDGLNICSIVFKE